MFSSFSFCHPLFQIFPRKPANGGGGELEVLELDFNGKYQGVQSQISSESDSESDEQWDDSSRFITFVKSFLFIGKSKHYGDRGREEEEDENGDLFDKI